MLTVMGRIWKGGEVLVLDSIPSEMAETYLQHQHHHGQYHDIQILDPMRGDVYHYNGNYPEAWVNRKVEWVTQRGEIFHVQSMTDEHLRNVIAWAQRELRPQVTARMMDEIHRRERVKK